jgi:hypothetical protein
MPDPIPAEAAPLSCEYCCNTEATEVFSADVLKLGRHTTFCCPACGDEQEFHVRRLGGQLWRFRITPLQEAQSG